ncbi:MAG: adenylate kinase [Sphingobacteriales bacterium]|nr:MAG: adenylate kinase [Sphingobacteriales bacterium]
MLNIVLFGPPGAGKGTQSEKLINKYGLTHISTGDLLRNEICQNTPLGLEAKKYMDEGQLVPDEVVIGMIENKLKDNKTNGIIFDGFPRTVAQAKALDALFESEDSGIAGMIALDVDKDELINRIKKRGETSGRSDDNEEKAIKRIEVYEKETRPVAEYYASQNKLVKVHGIGEIEEIFNQICQTVDELAAKKVV